MKRIVQDILILTSSVLGCAVPGYSAAFQDIGPYQQTAPFSVGLKHDEPDRTRWEQKYESLSRREKILYCIDQLQNEVESPGFFIRILPEGRYTDTPEAAPRAELIKIGKDAIPHLIAALDRTEKTRIVTWRHFAEPWLIQDAALDIIQKVTCREFSDAIHLRGPEKSYLAALSDNERNRLRIKIQTWWEANKHTDEVRWAEAALMSDRDDDRWYRGWAVRSLYARIGAKSYPILIRAYERLPKGHDAYDGFDRITSQKENILYVLQKAPSDREKRFLLQALEDKPFSIRLKAARCLWMLDDRTGLDQILRETEGMLSAWGDDWLRYFSGDLTGFFSFCARSEAKEMIVKCLDATNPYLRQSAIYEVPRLKMEKAVRKLPELFDDPFVIGGSYHTNEGDKWVMVPPRQICDAAAEAFNKTVPQSPRFGGRTDEQQEKSIQVISEWWKANMDMLVWNKEQGILEIKEQSNH